MTSPSSGVSPIVVSTDTPSRIAAALQPLPRWAVTRRSSPGRPAEQGRGPLADETVAGAVEPVTPHPVPGVPLLAAPRSGRPTAGMVWWNAVSNTATCGSPGRMALTASMPARFAGLCSGASRANSRIAAMTSSSTRTEALNRSPPWTTRWPTPMSCRPAGVRLRSATLVEDAGDDGLVAAVGEGFGRRRRPDTGGSAAPPPWCRPSRPGRPARARRCPGRAARTSPTSYPS